MLLSYAKAFNEKMRKQLVKAKKHVSNFSTISINNIKKKKKKIDLGVGIKILNNSQNTTIFTL